MLIGPNDLKQIALPASIDGAELQRLSLRDGTTFEAVVTDINDALTLAWASVKSNPLFQSLCSMTTRPDVEYRVGTQGGFKERTEYGEPDGIRAETSGHMLPFRAFDRGLQWTYDFLKEARQIQLDADVASVVEDLEKLIWKQLFERLFSLDALSGKRFGLGGNGKSVPFADGGASGVPFVPINRPDRAFVGAATHNHYLRLDGKTQDNLNAVVGHLWEHGHDGPFDMMCAETDVDAWAGVSGFKPKSTALVTPGANESFATVDDSFLGVIVTPKGPVRLRAAGQVESDFWNVHKSYGADDPRNPLRMRYDPLYGEGPVLRVETVKTLPLEGAIIEVRFGIGVGEDLTNSVNVMDAAAGAYRNPVISG